MTRLTPPIELLGLPGSGKSELFKRLVATGRFTGRNTWATPQGARSMPGSLTWVLHAPHTATALFLCVLFSRGWGITNLRYVGSVLRRVALLTRMATGPKGDVVVDEGPTHSLYIALYGTRMTAASRFFLRRALVDLSRPVGSFLFLDIPKEGCVRNWRRGDRGSLRFNAESPTAEVERFHRDTTYDEIRELLADIAPSKLYVVHDLLDGVRMVGAPGALGD